MGFVRSAQQFSWENFQKVYNFHDFLKYNEKSHVYYCKMFKKI